MANLKDYKNTPEYKLGLKKGRRKERNKKGDIYDQMGIAGLLIKNLQKSLGYKTHG